MSPHYLLIAALSLTVQCASTLAQEPQVSESIDSQFLLGANKGRLLGLRTSWQTTVPIAQGTTANGIFAPGGDSVFVTDSGCHLTRLATKSGSRIWSNACGRSTDRVVDVDRVQFMARDPEGHNGRLSDPTPHDELLVTLDSAIATFETATSRFVGGQKLERIPLTPAVTLDRYLIFGASGGQVAWQQYRVGHLWKCNELGGDIRHAPILFGPDSQPELAVASTSGEVAVLDPRTTRQIWRKKLPGAVEGSLALGEESLFAASLDQSIYALDLVTGKTKWRYLTDQPLKCNLFCDGDRVYGQLPGMGLVALNAVNAKIGYTEVAWSAAQVTGDAVCRIGRMLLVWDPQIRRMTAVDAASGLIEAQVDIPLAAQLKVTGPLNPDIYILSGDGTFERLESIVQPPPTVPQAAPAANP